MGENNLITVYIAVIFLVTVLGGEFSGIHYISKKQEGHEWTNNNDVLHSKDYSFKSVLDVQKEENTLLTFN